MAHTRRSVTRRRRGGSVFAENRLTLQQRVQASERLARQENISLAQALKRINKAQFDREARLRKRKR